MGQAKIRSAIDGNAYGSTKVLLPFKIEIEGMPWPCCKEMAATLDRLMEETAFGRD